MYKNKDNIVTGKKTVKVEYDWKPHMCSYCTMFGHGVEDYGCRPKTVEEIKEILKAEERKKEEAKTNDVDNDFVQVKNRKKNTNNTKQPVKNVENHQGAKTNTMIYKPIDKEKTNDEGSVGKSNQEKEVVSGNKVDKRSPNGKTGWNVHKDVIDSIRKSANKLFVLVDELDDEGPKEMVNEYIEEENDEEEVVPSLTDSMDFRITSWNIRGLGKKWDKDFGKWSWIDNAQFYDRGCRIMVGWDSDKIHCMMMHASDQAMLCLVKVISTKERLLCTFIHAEIVGRLRRKLWADMSTYKFICNNNPWVLLGYVNVTLNIDDHSKDISSTGLHYTWTESLHNPNSSVLKKINRVMGNEEFLNVHRRAHVIFLPYGISNHNHVVLTCSKSMKATSWSFRFANCNIPSRSNPTDSYVADVTTIQNDNVQTSFSNVVNIGSMPYINFVNIVHSQTDGSTIVGSDQVGHEAAAKEATSSYADKLSHTSVTEVNLRKSMLMLAFPVVEWFVRNNWKKYGLEKVTLVKGFFFFNFSSIEGVDLVFRDGSWMIRGILIFLNKWSPSASLLKKELSRVPVWVKFHDILTVTYTSDGLSLIASKIGNPMMLDSYTNSMCLESCTPKRVVNRVEKGNGGSSEADDDGFTEVKNKKLGGNRGTKNFKPNDKECLALDASIFHNKIKEQDASAMIGEVSNEEIKADIKEFFVKGKFLGELNSTLITLVPKVSTPSKVTDFRPIACCNVAYKCISKIITNRIKIVLDSIVHKNQSAFIPERQITDNILLTQELLKGYDCAKGPKRCSMKIDIRKAYDIVDWGFLKNALKLFGFPHKMVKWVVTCVSTPSYSICINGERHGYFKGDKGLRQGDPMSPYIFIIVMEVFNLIIQQIINEEANFKYHFGCKSLKITHLCFVDDLLVMCHGDVNSVKVIKRDLEAFSNVSGFYPNLGKSIVFCGSMNIVSIENVLNILTFKRGNLLVRYLGVPLVAKKIVKWPTQWFNKYPILNQYLVHVLNNDVEDKLMWCSSNESTNVFSSSQVWKDLKTLNGEMLWWKVIWFSLNIPRQAFVLWMATKGKLVTQNKLAKWYPDTVYHLWLERNTRLFQQKEKVDEKAWNGVVVLITILFKGCLVDPCLEVRLDLNGGGCSHSSDAQSSFPLVLYSEDVAAVGTMRLNDWEM
ncbi:RNA-directed DNA polymerase, eukaryota, reverse transcriptase zinc-binding domain protein [Tanacetum coccineum]